MTPNSVNRFYLIIKSSNGYIEECNGNKYLTIVPTDENRDMLKQYEKMGKQSKTLLDQ